ncbi:MAG TPA: M1 family metallopeptidase [Chitinophagaceae bacterium]|nr:M1 family metallopeptidase [Chitinophagaceae bacterium]
MRRVIFLLAILLIWLQGITQSNIDVLHYKFDISLNDKTDSVEGLATILFIPLVNTDAISLDLVKESKGKGMIVTRTLLSLLSSTVPSFLQEDDKLIINKPGGFRKGDTTEINISYKGVPADGLIISKNKYGHRTFFADNWPDRGHNWIPCNDDPADKATVEFIVTAPQHYQVVANGIQIEETNLPDNKKITHWKEDVPISTKVMVIGAADFAVNLSGVIADCIPVYSWVYPENREKGFYDYALANEILPFYINKIGPYPYKKLANVQSKTRFGGLENANTIFYSEESIDGKGSSESLLAHEIAHQWFGNYATEKSFAHLWLSEGFATYMTILYMENKYGEDTAIQMLKEDREQAIAFAKRNKDLSIVNHTRNYMSLLNPNSYQKGGWVLHMLRRQLGDSVFWKSIRTYYAAHGGKTADSDDLRKIFEKVSGKNLEQFFKQWVYSPGVPELDIQWSYNDKLKNISVTVSQLQKNTLFEFPLEILIQETSLSMPKRFTRNINKETETFTIPVSNKPSRFEADPLTSLLFEGHISGPK